MTNKIREAVIELDGQWPDRAGIEHEYPGALYTAFDGNLEMGLWESKGEFLGGDKVCTISQFKKVKEETEKEGWVFGTGNPYRRYSNEWDGVLREGDYFKTEGLTQKTKKALADKMIEAGAVPRQGDNYSYIERDEWCGYIGWNREGKVTRCNFLIPHFEGGRLLTPEQVLGKEVLELDEDGCYIDLPEVGTKCEMLLHEGVLWQPIAIEAYSRDKTSVMIKDELGDIDCWSVECAKFRPLKTDEELVKEKTIDEADKLIEEATGNAVDRKHLSILYDLGMLHLTHTSK